MKKIEINKKFIYSISIVLIVLSVLGICIINKYTKNKKENLKETYIMGKGPWKRNKDGTITSSDGITVEIGKTTYTTEQVAEKLQIEIEDDKYNGNWVVLGVDGTKLKLISEENLEGKIILGKKDFGIDKNKIEEIYDYDSSTDLDLEKAIWSWNNAVDTLNTAVKEKTGIKNARSVKLEDLEKDVLNITDEIKKESKSNYGKTFKYYLEDGKIYSQNILKGKEKEWSRKAGGYEKGIFVTSNNSIINNTLENKGKRAELKYTNYYYNFTEEQKKELNSIAIGDYWLASTCISCSDTIANFYVRYMYGGNIYSSSLFTSYGFANSGNELGVRAVILV